MLTGTRETDGGVRGGRGTVGGHLGEGRERER